jgi:hypothetical protein
VVALLAAAPARIASCTSGVPAGRLRRRPDPDAWSANEVLAHLRACADVWGGCIATILAEEGPTIRAVNPRTWIDETDHRELDFHPSFDAFSRQRRALVTVLESLTPDAWERTATVTGAGRVLERSVHAYAERLATHERPHLAQIERAVAASDPPEDGRTDA